VTTREACDLVVTLTAQLSLARRQRKAYRLLAQQALQCAHTPTPTAGTRPMPMTADLTGRQFGSWTVLAHAPRVPGQKPTCECRCACGTTATVRVSNLLHGHSRSCGCQTRAMLRESRP